VSGLPNHRPLRVLWLTTSASWDGPGRALAAILRHWPEPGDAINVWALRQIEPAFAEGIPSRVATYALGMRGAADLGAIASLIRYCRSWRPDVIHTQLSRADWIGRVVGRSLGVPVVSTIQNVHSRMYAAEFSPVTGRIGAGLDRLTSRWASRCIAVSSGVAADLGRSGVPADRVTVIFNPFDRDRAGQRGDRETARRFFGATGDDPVIGTVALLKVQKGIRDLVDAARIVAASHPRARFVHVGGGPMDGEVRAWIAAAGLTDRFTLVGWVDDPLTLLPGMDVFVLPSHWEGLPIALLEAMAAGVPVVGTAVPGIEEVIVDGETGRLVPARDPVALASAMLELAASSALRQQYGHAGLGRLDVFDARVVAAATREVYLDVLSPTSAGTSRS
jgi:glycosyltransferase involved in cell wall biosynthesis